MRDRMEKSEVFWDKWPSCVIRWCGPALECDGKGAPSHILPQFITLGHKGYHILTWLRIANYRARINLTVHLAPDTAWFSHLQEGRINSSSQQHHCHNKLALPREVTGRITSILERLTKQFNPAASLGSVLAQQWLTRNAHMPLMCWKTLWKFPLGKSCNSPAMARLQPAQPAKTVVHFTLSFFPPQGCNFLPTLVALDFNPDGRKESGPHWFF